MKPAIKKTLLFSAKLLLSIALFIYVLHGLDFKQLRGNLINIDPLMFALAVALQLIQTFIINGRWMLIMRSIGASIGWFAGWRILMISLWFNQALPSSAGGDVVRIWLVRRHGVQWKEAVKGVVADRLTALMGIVALMVLGFPFLSSRVSNPSAILVIGGLAAGGAFGTATLLTLHRWPDRIASIRPIASFVRFGNLVRFLLLQSRHREILVLSAIVIHLITTAACYVLASGLHAGLSAINAAIMVPLVILLSAMPISIGGWGVREGAMVACLTLVGVTADKAVAVSLLLGVTSAIVGAVGGIVWLTSPERGTYTSAQALAAADEGESPRQSPDDRFQRAEDMAGPP